MQPQKTKEMLNHFYLKDETLMRVVVGVGVIKLDWFYLTFVMRKSQWDMFAL